MDLDLAFVAALGAEGAAGWQIAIQKGIRADFLAGEGRTAFEYISEHFKTYGSIPEIAVLEGRLGLEIGPAQGSVAYFADEIHNRSLHGSIQTGVAKIVTTLREGAPKDAFTDLERLVSNIRREQVVGTRVKALGEVTDEVWTFYEKLKAGETGVLTPWATMNDATLGFWPQDLVVVVARQGTGKTWFAIVTALHAWLNNKRVLFVTTELAQVSVAMRIVALHNRVSYSEFRHGRLATFTEDKVRQSLDSLKQMDGFFLIGGDFDFRTESLEAAIEEVSPDLVVADGAYLLDAGDGNNRTEKAAAAFNELKRIAKRRNTVILATTQFNRSASSDKASSIKIENAGLTDVIGWNADLAYGLLQTEDMRNDKVMKVKPLKVREGAGREFDLQWDLEAMAFQEIQQASPEADEFGTGVTVPPSGSSEDSGMGELFAPVPNGASTGTDDSGELF